ncbi:hypothetical protein LOK49_LG15G00192 [Camellia lanceoleosa]|uniref:Uncharacterized protein n=1 Tax=Camellia lanceoleosa TaxID=1840588 RepID=A0ACC0F2B5_9ERIC|nr:hypothetical protein LOK49_LG15G00192 [Camellia lanceoleosa]
MPGLKRNAHVDESFDSVRAVQAEGLGDNGAPIVTDKEDLVEIQGVKEGDEIADDVKDGVAGGGRRSIGVAVAAEIGADCSFNWRRRERESGGAMRTIAQGSREERGLLVLHLSLLRACLCHSRLCSYALSSPPLLLCNAKTVLVYKAEEISLIEVLGGFWFFCCEVFKAALVLMTIKRGDG